MTVDDIGRRVDALADTLVRNGDLTDPRWREALREVPRQLFIPAVAWATPYDGPGHRIDRERDPAGWLAAAYADHPVVTQLDDGSTDVGTGAGSFTSSVSAPGVVLCFLELLDVYDGDNVLEIGTGSGWTAGLLAHRVGGERVTSVEIDPALSEQAAASLKSAGSAPRLVIGDGVTGVPDEAPFDRVHVTCGVTTIPYAWVAQTRPGGVIVLPWMPEHAGGHKLRLVVLDDGTAVGRFPGGANYMMLRSQRSTPTDADGDVRETTTDLDPRRVSQAAWGADVAITGMLPDVSSYPDEDEDGRFRLRLWTDDSDAVVTYAPAPERTIVRSRGPRDLWAEVAEAFFTWSRWGEPGRDRFGMTVSPEGQHVWLDQPDRVITRRWSG